MSTFDSAGSLGGKSYTGLKNINLRGGAKGTGLIRWSPSGIFGQNAGLWASNPFGTDDYGLYLNSAGNLVFSNPSGATVLGAPGSGGGLPTWDQIFVGDQALDVGGTNTLTVTSSGTGSNGVCAVTSTAAGSGVLLQITNGGSGKDINGTSSTWYVSAAGAAVFASAAIPTLTATTITGTSTTLTLAASGASAVVIGTGSNTVTIAKAATFSSTVTVTAGVVTLADTANETGLQFTSSATSAGISGAGTGTVVFKSTTLTTGTLLKLQVAEGTLTNGWYLQAYDSSTSATMFSIAKYGATVITGSAYGTAALTLTAGDIVVTAGAINHTAVGATTANGYTGTFNGLTTGIGMSLVHTTSVITTGSVLSVSSTGVDTGTGQGTLANFVSSGSTAGLVLKVTGAALIGGTLASLSTTALTTGTVLSLSAVAATLTTGFYLACNDGGLNVFTIGANGHLTSKQTTAPTIATNSTGISACAITAGSTDTAGTVTTTGTPQSGTVLTITFAKTYTTAPKVVLYAPANAAAGGINTMPIITTTATTAVFTWPGSGVYAATPSFTYFVMA